MYINNIYINIYTMYICMYIYIYIYAPDLYDRIRASLSTPAPGGTQLPLALVIAASAGMPLPTPSG